MDSLIFLDIDDLELTPQMRIAYASLLLEAISEFDIFEYKDMDYYDLEPLEIATKR